MADATRADVPEGHGSVGSAVSDALVKVYKERFGRGPQNTRTLFAGDDTLVCTLQGSLTRAEHRLLAAGEHSRVRDARLYLQQAAEETLFEVIEQITGRRVWGYVCGIDTKRDVATEVFCLEPQPPGSG